MRFRTFLTVLAAGALLAIPATGQAHHKTGHTKGGKGTSKSCAKAGEVAFNVGGTYVSSTPDDPAVAGNQASVTVLVTSANSHARKSGELADTDATKPGLQYKGGTYTVSGGGTDDFTVRFNGYEAPDTASPGDKVNVSGKVPLTKKKCAPSGTSTADRYGKPDIRRVTISDRDPDA